MLGQNGKERANCNETAGLIVYAWIASFGAGRLILSCERLLRRIRRFVNEALWVCLKCVVERVLMCRMNGVSLSVAHVV